MSEHTDIAATTTHQKIVTDAERMVATVAWTAPNNLDADTKERFYGLLEQA